MIRYLLPLLIAMLCLSNAAWAQPAEKKIETLLEYAKKEKWGLLKSGLENLEKEIQDQYPVSVNILEGLLAVGDRNAFGTSCSCYEKAYNSYVLTSSTDTFLVRQSGILDTMNVDDWLAKKREDIHCQSSCEQAIVHCLRPNPDIQQMDKFIGTAKNKNEHVEMPNAYNYVCGLRAELCSKNAAEACFYYGKVDMDSLTNGDGKIFSRYGISYGDIAKKNKGCPEQKLPLATKEALLKLDRAKSLAGQNVQHIEKLMDEALRNEEYERVPYSYYLLQGLYYELRIEGGLNMKDKKEETEKACICYKLAKSQTISPEDEEIVMKNYTLTWLTRDRANAPICKTTKSDKEEKIDSIKYRILETKRHLEQLNLIPKYYQEKIDLQLAEYKRKGLPVPRVTINFDPSDSTSLIIEFYIEPQKSENVQRVEETYYYFPPGKYKGMDDYNNLLSKWAITVLNDVGKDGDVSQVIAKILATADANKLSKHHCYLGDILGKNPLTISYFSLNNYPEEDNSWKNNKARNDKNNATVLTIKQNESIGTDWNLCALRGYYFTLNIKKIIEDRDIPGTYQVFAFDYPDDVDKYKGYEYRRLEAKITFIGILESERAKAKKEQKRQYDELKKLEAQ